MVHVLIEGFGSSGLGWSIAASGVRDVKVSVIERDGDLHPADVVVCGPLSSRSPHEAASSCGARILLEVLDGSSDSGPSPMGRSKLARRWNVPLDAEGFGSLVIGSCRVSCHSVQSLTPPRRTHGPAAPLDASGQVVLWDEAAYRGMGIPVDHRDPAISRDLKLAMEGKRPLPILPGFAFALPRSVASFPVEADGGVLQVSGMLCHSQDSSLGFVLITVPEIVSLIGYPSEMAEELDWNQIRELVPVSFLRGLLEWCDRSYRQLPEDK